MTSALLSSTRVLIIGAGSAAIAMAHNLRKAGIEDYIVLEKSNGIGGTWFYNRYPGAGCDVQSHLYAFSFAPKLDWSRPFADQPEILAYLNQCADQVGMRAHVRFNTEVRSLTWRDDTARWIVKTGDGHVIEASIVVSAIGMFNELVWPDIPGIADFKGTKFHSARWNHDHKLDGERVGVIGIAASAVQFVPEIAPVVKRLDLYQRTANWCVPKENAPYTKEQLAHFKAHPEAVKKIRDETYNVWNTLATFKEKELLAEIEQAGLDRLAQVRDPEVRRKLTPNHPLGCKRPTFSDVYYPTFNRDNVELITEGISRITPTGIETVDGKLREVDTIIFSTGFKTTKYLRAMTVTGRKGINIEDVWSDGAQAYIGMTVSGFPNLFILYGPNTNQGCILFMLERQTEYIRRQIERMDSEQLAWIDVKPDAMQAYNAQLQQDVNSIDAWKADCGNDFYYRSPTGRFVTNFPHSMDEFAARTSRVEPEKFETGRRS